MAFALTAAMMLTPSSGVFAADETVSAQSIESVTDSAAANVELNGIITSKYIVNVDSLNVRAGRGTSYAVLATLSMGTTISVYNRSLSNGWVKIKLSSGTGYVFAEYITRK